MTRRKHVAALAGSVGAVAVVTLAIELFKSFVPVLSLGVLYVFAVLVVALVWGMAYAIPVAVASMLAFNWFHLPPLYTFTVADGSNWFALAAYVVVAVTVSLLADRVRRRAAEAEQREREAALLADVAGDLLGGRGLQGELESISARTAQVLGVSRARIELGRHAPPAGEAPLPLEADKRMVGTLYLPEGEAPSLAERGRFLPALASLLAVAVDRERLEREAVDADALRRSDTVKTAVLQAVSHDLRSPLTAIRAAADGLRSEQLELDDFDRAELVETIRHRDQAARSARLEPARALAPAGGRGAAGTRALVGRRARRAGARRGARLGTRRGRVRPRSPAGAASTRPRSNACSPTCSRTRSSSRRRKPRSRCASPRRGRK